MVGKCDPVTACDFGDLMLTVAIECSLVDVVVAFVDPVEFGDLTFVPHEQWATYGIRQRDCKLMHCGTTVTYRCGCRVGKQGASQNCQLLMSVKFARGIRVDLCNN